MKVSTAAALLSTLGYHVLWYSKEKSPAASLGLYMRQSPSGPSSWRTLTHLTALLLLCHDEVADLRS